MCQRGGKYGLSSKDEGSGASREPMVVVVVWVGGLVVLLWKLVHTANWCYYRVWGWVVGVV